MATEKGSYTAAEVAQLLNVSEASVYEGCRRGEIPCLRIGRRVTFPRLRFDAWMQGGMALQERPAVDSALKH